MSTMRALLLCWVSFTAAAQDAGTPSGPPAPAKELAEAMKPFDGNWKCTGKVNDNPMGKGHSYAGKYTQKSELGGFWYVARHEETKTKDSPTPYSMIMTVGWDPEKKQLSRSDVDNMGGITHGTSKGWEGDKLIWEGSMVGGPEKITFKDTITKKGPKETHWATELTGPDGKSAVILEMTCKK